MFMNKLIGKYPRVKTSPSRGYSRPPRVPKNTYLAVLRNKQVNLVADSLQEATDAAFIHFQTNKNIQVRIKHEYRVPTGILY